MAESNNIKSVVDALMKDMDSLVATKTVIGDPIKVDDAVIVPLVDVSFGVAAGSGSRDNNKKDCGIGGANAKMSPSAVLVIQNGHAKIVTVKGQDSISKIIDAIPEVIDKIKDKKGVTVDDDVVIEKAFPEEE